MDSFNKDPEAVLDYQIDWTLWLDSDTITASEWSSSNTNIVIDSNSFTTLKTTVWLSGGVLSESGIITNHITTTSGREDDRSIKIKIKAK